MQNRYNKDKHHRRSIRLRGWDYTTPGSYFITICTYQRQNLFEDRRYKEVVENAWQAIPTQPGAHHAGLDEWVVMPNHLHGILVLSKMKVNTGEAATRHKTGRADNPQPGSPLPYNKPGSVGAIVGNFKSRVTRQINCLRLTSIPPVWQRGYYDHIIRHERELEGIRRYIQENPLRWELDRDNLESLLARMQEHADT